MFDEVTAGSAADPNRKEVADCAGGFDPKLNEDVDGEPKVEDEPKLNWDLTVESTFFSLADEPSFGVLQQTHSLSV